MEQILKHFHNKLDTLINRYHADYTFKYSMNITTLLNSFFSISCYIQTNDRILY